MNNPIKKANVVFDALEAQGVEFPDAPTRVEVSPNGAVRIDVNLDTISGERANELIADIPADFTYDEHSYAYCAKANLLGINVVFRFFIDTQAHEEAR